jgi:hypothetical protein
MPSKAVERAVLDMCQQKVPGFPQGQVVERKGPDFYVLGADRIIGVEMQEFVQGAGPEGASGRREESLRATVTRCLRRTRFQRKS